MQNSNRLIRAYDPLTDVVDMTRIGATYDEPIYVKAGNLIPVMTGRIPSMDLVAGNNPITVIPYPAGVYDKYEATVRSNKTGEEVAVRLIKEGIDTFTLQTAVAYPDVRVTWFAINN